MPRATNHHTIRAFAGSITFDPPLAGPIPAPRPKPRPAPMPAFTMAEG